MRPATNDTGVTPPLNRAERSARCRRAGRHTLGAHAAPRRFLPESHLFCDGREIAIERFMLKRLLLMLLVMTVFLGVLGFVKFKQIQVAIAQGASFQPPPEAVTTIVAREEQWPATLSAIGTAAAVRGVAVSADLPGTVERIEFESGNAVREGNILALLDTRQEQAQLAAAEAQL